MTMTSSAILANTIGWTACLVIGVLGLLVLNLVVRGRIDLSMLISEPNGGASMSRFQLLIFTFVIGLGLFYAVVARGDGTFPDIPGNLLALLGISGSSYLVSKGIQFSQKEGIEDRPPLIVVKPVEVAVAPGKRQRFTAEMIGNGGTEVEWSVVSGPGQIDADGIYSPPAGAQAEARAVIKAASIENADLVAFAVVTLVGA